SSAPAKAMCTNCRHSGHLTKDCFQPGGAMEGRRDEVLAAKCAKCDQNRPHAAAVPKTYTDAQGCAFIVDTSGSVVYLAVEVSAASPGVSELTGVAVDVDPAWLNSVCSPADDLEYVTLLSEDASVSLDWGTHSQASVDPSAYAVTPVVASSCRVPTVGSTPSYFDSGASTHLSPSWSDFSKLHPIAPRGIRGINRSVIHAHGIGHIRLAL
ncbi:hypothetical protein WOLCODRAFT_53771, partial [Wolfiporia cocos MD-104 SS10]